MSLIFTPSKFFPSSQLAARCFLTRHLLWLNTCPALVNQYRTRFNHVETPVVQKVDNTILRIDPAISTKYLSTGSSGQRYPAFAQLRPDLLLVPTVVARPLANERNIIGHCMLWGVVAQSLKSVKLLSQQLPTFLLFSDRRSVAQ